MLDGLDCGSPDGRRIGFCRSAIGIRRRALDAQTNKIDLVPRLSTCDAAAVVETRRSKPRLESARVMRTQLADSQCANGRKSLA